MTSRLGPSLRSACQLAWLRRWWLNRSIRLKGLIVIVIPLLTLLVSSSESLALQANERRVRAEATDASNLRSAAEAVLFDALNAETGVRGYAATGQPVFLEPYAAASRELAVDLRSFRAAAGADGTYRHARAADATAAQVMSGLAALRRAVGARAGGQAQLRMLLAGKAHMDLLRSQVGAIVSQAGGRVAAGRAAITGQETKIEDFNVGGLLLGLLAGIAGIALFTSGIAGRVAAAAANADQLGKGEQAEPSDTAGDELGGLNISLARAGRLLTARAGELIAARDEALRATRTKNAFMSRTSHELRTPLNSILGFAQLLVASDLSADDRDSAERILQAGRHLLSLINEVIDIARIESGELSISLEPVTLATLMAETCHLMTPLAQARSITISQRCPHPGLAARADRQRLSQVLVNLLSNAVKYNREGGTIDVGCLETGDALASIVVADTGPGITAENLQRIFIPFDRAGAELTKIEGTGIGLPLARALTEAMGGRLTASSAPGRGSTFTATLERAPDQLPAVLDPAEPPTPRTAGETGISILYIEDNPANVELISRFVSNRQGCELRYATSGRAGLDSAVREIPDIILLDVHLPDIAGDLVLSQLRTQTATAAIPVVILSADANPDSIRRLLASGAAAYLTKPVDLAELGRLLDGLAAHARRHQPRAEARPQPPPPRGDAERPVP